MRGLSEQHIQDLLGGSLAPLLKRVLADDTLDLQIRARYLNVYYRGVNLVKNEESAPGKYVFQFDTNYFGFPDAPQRPISEKAKIESQEHCDAWLQHASLLKDCIDRWFVARRQVKREREAQQMLVRENTWDPRIAERTDYFICDAEYAADGRTGQFDAVAVKWPSSSVSHKKGSGHRLAFVEIKFGDWSLAGKSGILEHVRDVLATIREAHALDTFKTEMMTLFNQKSRLGLIRTKRTLESFSHERPELLIVVCDHKPASTVLHRELKRLGPIDGVEIKIAVASNFGYGLYEKRTYTPDDYLKLIGS